MVSRGLAPSIERARALIMAGRVRGPDRRYEKPGLPVPLDAAIEVSADRAFVSRGGQKLAAALDAWEIPIAGRVCLDVGASTGGFSDCLLQRGACRVYAVDVGYGQLADSLRQDPRIMGMERTDIRSLSNRSPRLDPGPGFGAVDVSFISLREVLPAVAKLVPAGANVVALIKPQFEAAKEAVGHDGVVRSPQVRAAVIQGIINWALRAGWRVGGVLRSPLTGPKGNEEFLLWLRTPLLAEESEA